MILLKVIVEIVSRLLLNVPGNVISSEGKLDVKPEVCANDVTPGLGDDAVVLAVLVTEVRNPPVVVSVAEVWASVVVVPYVVVEGLLLVRIVSV